MFGPPPQKALWPEGWGSDPDAFRSGLDLETRELTKEDAANLTAWYENTIGYVPKSIEFAMKRNPKFLKLNRARWERTIKAAPKQLAPYLMLRHNTITQSLEGLKEAALLGKAWGFTPDLVVRSVTNTAMYFTGNEGLYACYEALDPILEDWQ